MRSDIGPGGTFPDYELPDHTNVPRRLSELQDRRSRLERRLILVQGPSAPRPDSPHRGPGRVREGGIR